MLSASKLRQELNRMKLKEDKDPVDFFEKIAIIQMQARKIKDDTISEKEIVSKIVTAAPKMYMATIRTLQKEKGSSLEIEDLEDERCELYRMCNINENDEESDSENEGKETALLTQGYVKVDRAFAGKCYNCGKTGHRAVHCPDKKEKSGDGKSQKKAKFQGTCHGCGKYGHKKADCWKDESNASKRPKNWKGGEAGMPTKTKTRTATVTTSSC